MTEHHQVRELLALAAAGVLGPEEQRLVDAHSSGCEACASELAAWRTLTEGLQELPTPSAPPALVERTRARILGEQAAAADRWWDGAVLAVLALFTWTLGLATWAIVRVLGGGLQAVLTASFLDTLKWLTVSTVWVWATAGVAAIVLGRHRQLARRSL